MFCLIFPSDYDKVLNFSNDMHFSDILTDFSLNYNKVQDFLLTNILNSLDQVPATIML